jgi:hypothetical protein
MFAKEDFANGFSYHRGITNDKCPSFLPQEPCPALLKWLLPGSGLEFCMSSKPPDPIIIDDVLPPLSKTRAAGPGAPQSSELARFLAKWLDDLLRVPGTNFKIGLDPLLAFIPGVGGAAAAGSGLLILLEGVRSGVSIPVLLRMGANMGINSVLDLIPFLGPVGSAFFKSNSRNLRLLQRWQAGQQQAIRQSTTRLMFVFALLALFILSLSLMIAYFWWSFLIDIFKHIFGVA